MYFLFTKKLKSIIHSCAHRRICGLPPSIHSLWPVRGYLVSCYHGYIGTSINKVTWIKGQLLQPAVFNPLPTIGNSLKKQKSLYKVLMPSIKPPI